VFSFVFVFTCIRILKLDFFRIYFVRRIYVFDVFAFAHSSFEYESTASGHTGDVTTCGYEESVGADAISRPIRSRVRGRKCPTFEISFLTFGYEFTKFHPSLFRFRRRLLLRFFAHNGPRYFWNEKKTVDNRLHQTRSFNTYFHHRNWQYRSERNETLNVILRPIRWIENREERFKFYVYYNY